MDTKESKIEKEFAGRAGGEPVRLNKLLGEAGVCSRREADRLIEAGRVSVDGREAVMGERVRRDSVLCIDGRPVKRVQKMILLAVNKPQGIVCTAEPREKNNIVKFLNYPERIYPVGRLDKDSEGLLLMTNNGAIVNKMMRAANFHEKEYVVRVDRPLSREFLDKMAAGVPILDTVTRPCRVERTGKYDFRIILTQGLNRQIRRMCEYLGYEVKYLKRVRIMNIHLGTLPTGSWREVTKKEQDELYELIRFSVNDGTDYEGQKRPGGGM